MKILKVKNYDELSQMTANLIAEQVKQKPTSVLGFATGSTPIGTYEKLVQMYKNGEIDFSNVTTFNLDEYRGLNKKNPQSYHYFMTDSLFSHINLPTININFPNGMASDIAKECNSYENKIARAGGIDLQLLGVGQNGHIGFNEPDEVFHNKTHLVNLSDSTVHANARFFDKVAEVPTTAITMGIGTIMSAKKIVLIAGADKADVIEKLKSETVSPKFPVSVLHYHPDCTVIFVSK